MVLECNIAHRRSIVVLYMLNKIMNNPKHPHYGVIPVIYAPWGAGYQYRQHRTELIENSLIVDPIKGCAEINHVAESNESITVDY